MDNVLFWIDEQNGNLQEKNVYKIFVLQKNMFMVMDLSKMNFDKTPRFLQKIFKMTKPSKIILNPGLAMASSVENQLIERNDGPDKNSW